MSDAWKNSERLVAKKLSLWWTANKDAFKRAPVSGGWPKKRSHGDIVANDDVDQPDEVVTAARGMLRLFAVDVKRRVQGSTGEWHLEQLLSAAKHPILKWWEEIGALADHLGRMRMLIFTKAKRQYCLMFGSSEMEWLVEQLDRSGLDTDTLLGTRAVFSIIGLDEELTVFDFDKFIKRIDAQLLGGKHYAQDSNTQKEKSVDSSEIAGEG